jgi:hypothetical protein
VSFDLPLPGWLADVEVAFGRVPASLTKAARSGVLWQATGRRFLIRVPGVARYLVHDGRSLVVDPEPDCSPGEIARLLHATPFAVLCHQRGLSVLHAAAASRDGATVLVAGNSGAGKSALLAELLVRGWRMVTDDVAPIALDEAGRPIALPTFPELVLGRDTPDRIRAAPTIANRAFQSTATRLEAIWWLSTDNFQGAVKVEPLSAVKGFRALGAMAYNRRIADAILDPDQRLRSDAPIATAVPVRRVIRPRGRWTLTELADLIETCQTVN